MSKKCDKLRQIRVWAGLDEEIDALVEMSPTKSSFGIMANEAIARGIEVLKKEIALKPKREK